MACIFREFCDYQDVKTTLRRAERAFFPFSFGFVLSLLAVYLVSMLCLSGRVLTNRDGKQVEATVLSVDGDNVRIRRGDGREFTLKLSTLSDKDQQELRKVAPRVKEMKPRPLSLVSQDRILKASAGLDALVLAGHKRRGISANPPISDSVFLRRVYLDIVGRIPTFDEAVTFLEDKNLNKRRALIDSLLESEGYVSHFFNYWADILRINSGKANAGTAEYIDWAKQAIRRNIPYDDMVTRLITAEGHTWENGATGYYLRDQGMPLDNMSNTARIFLGTQLVCAQCHDHPFDDWKQYQYYELAAFTFGVNTRVGYKKLNEVDALFKKAGNKEDAKRYRIAAERMFRDLTYGAKDTKKEVRLPHDYQYDDAEPKQVVKPSTIFGNKVKSFDYKDRRAVYAAWMTGKDNPRFAKVIANRLWKKLMGVGLFEPVDDLRNDTKVSDPKLMEFLTNLMVELDLDLKQYIRVILHSQSYQRAVSENDYSPDEGYYYPGPLLRRMSAEQIWDSILAMTVPYLDDGSGGTQRSGGMMNYGRMGMLTQAKVEDIAAYIKAKTDIETNAAKELLKIQEEIGNLGPTPKERALKVLREKEAEIRRLRDRQISDLAFVNSPGMGSMGGMGMMDGGSMSNNNGVFKGLERASSLRSPAAGDHLLRIFGQSDRESIENASTTASVSQVLALLNGKFNDALILKVSVLGQNLEKSRSPKQKLNTIYLSALSRYPSDEEMLILAKAARIGKKQGFYLEEKYIEMEYQDILWALLNTRQFAFIQ